LVLTRRDLLGAFLGAPFAALACRRESQVVIPPGDLVGASHAVGHRLRDPGAPLVPTQWEAQDVVIAGGGAAGLSAAWRLRSAGIEDVLLLELEPALGGTARSGKTYPWGAHYVIAPSPDNRVLIRLLTEIGALENGSPAEQFVVHDPEERVFYRGRWYEGLFPFAGATHEDLRQLRVFEDEMKRWGAWRDGRGRAAFTIPVAYASDDAEVTALDRMSMKQWMDARALTSPRLRWFVEYGCRDDYGTLLDQTSAWAGVFYFASREERPVITWPEGNGRIIAHLARSAPSRLNWLVTQVTPTEQGADVIAVRGEETIGIHARRVIFAGPQFVARHVIPSRPAPEGFTYGSWMVANLALRDRPASLGFPMAWDNVLYDSPALGYVTATHQRGPSHGPTILTYYYALCDADPRVARERLLSASREEWADVALTDLSRAHRDLRGLTERVDIMRWGHAMVRPSPGFAWSESRRNASRPHGAIHFANTDLSAVPLFEEALYHGVRAAEEVAAALGRGGSTWV
jgi:hypothetical protein